MDYKSIESSKKPFIICIRWIAVLPVGIIAFCLSQVIILLARGFENGFTEGSDHWSQFISGILCPYFFVWAGAMTAPRFRFGTAIVLTLLHTTLSGYYLFIFPNQIEPLWWLIINMAGSLAGCIAASFGVRSKKTILEIWS